MKFLIDKVTTMASVDMSLDDEMAGDRIDFPDAGFPVDSGLDSDCDLDLSDTMYVQQTAVSIVQEQKDKRTVDTVASFDLREN